ncbi:MAG: hypothetical protein FWH01_03535 [Oscillospiraceae bacterium]|nr:hypothetical protein [Oscillospiraceae bacterium]
MIDPKMFKDPAAKYRPAPFWSWNHKLVPERLVEQIRSMHEQGLGGFYMHARAGLMTEYLSKEWEKAVEACIKEGERLGMYADLYDEDCYPSGNAGGLVTKGRPEFAAQCVVLRECEPSGAGEDAGAGADADAGAGSGAGTGADADAGAGSGAGADYVSADGKSYFFEIITSPDSPRWGAPSPDTMNKAAMNHYIEITYDWYKERFGQYFGADFSNVVPSIFADEPNISTRFGRLAGSGVLAVIPWSGGFREEFINRKGYDVWGVLAGMFFDIPGYEKTRFDFYDVSFNLFLEAFTKQIYEWCAKNNLDFTCHYWEHNYPLTIMQGDVMAHYEYLQIPGIDMLFNLPDELEHEQFGFDLIVKEVSSAAIHTGKKRTMSETHGAGGWDVTFKDQKRMLDWQFALGINYVIPHLFYLSMQGDRKRDFPLSFINEPWWGEYKVLADYIGRLCYLMSEGSFVADTLVLHNFSSTYAAYSPMGDNKYLLELGEETRDLLTSLSGEQIYYNLGSENLLARHAKAENGKIAIEGMEYAFLVIPPSITITPATLSLISEFKKQGGRIVCAGRKPDLIDGEKSGELAQVLADITGTAVNGAALELKKMGAIGLRLTPLDKASQSNMRYIYAHERDIGGKRLLFICNISRYETIEFSLPVSGSVNGYNCETGEISSIPYYGDSLGVRLYPCGSVCYLIDTAAPAERLMGDMPKYSLLADYKDFAVSREQDNMLAINACTVEMDGVFVESGMATAIELKLREHEDRKALASRRQPWTFTAEERAVKKHLRARYTFYIEGNVSHLRVAAEYPDDFSVSLNGVKLSADGWFIDRDIVCYPASHAIKQGENIIELDGLYGLDTTIESVYLLGGFTVAGGGESGSSGGGSGSGSGYYILKDDAMPGLGNAAEQGHPFYCGMLSYETEVEIGIPAPGARVIAKLNGFNGAAAKVFLNGKAVAVLGWAPYEADITEFVVQGKNALRVDVYSSGQNIFGPHSKLKMPGLVSPGSFYEPDEGVFFPYGLYEGVSILTLGR